MPTSGGTPPAQRVRSAAALPVTPPVTGAGSARTERGPGMAGSRSPAHAPHPEDDSSPPESRWWQRVVAGLALACSWMLRNPGWGVSIALHAAAAVVVGYLVVQAQFDTQSKGIEALFSQPGEVIAFDQIGVESSISVQAADSPVTPLVGVGEPGGAGDEAADLTDLMNSAGSGSGQSSGDGLEGGAEQGLGAAFFGSQAAGKTFVYVVDMSGSMYGPRFERAKTELCNSLGKLTSQQKFYVYFFSDKTLPMMAPRPPRGLLAASKPNREKATRWVKSREPGGLTNPLPALRQALEMKPEVIFLLTDGEVDDPAELREQIKKLNKSKTTIHTIAFESEEGEATLKAIAEEHNGTYRFVR